MLDLTPFGFTPTESSAYRSLLELGPSSGYAVARALSIARANAYQALDGLVAKGAALLASDVTPRRYRAIQPRALFAEILAAESRKLDSLEQQMLNQPAGGATPVLHLRGERALMDLAVRMIVRTEGNLSCIAPASRLDALAPAFRARAAAGRSATVWSPDPPPEAFPIPVARLDPSRLPQELGPGAVLLVADGALTATFDEEPEGVWSESPIVVSLVATTITHAASSTI
jgi:hypothetical protein